MFDRKRGDGHLIERGLWRTIGRILRRAATVIATLYTLMAAVVVASFPEGSSTAVKKLRAEILLAPLLAPSIIHTHIRLASISPRPKVSDDEFLSVDNLLQDHGKWTGRSTAVTLDTSPPELRNQRTAHGAPEGSSSIELYEDAYSAWFVGAALGHNSGGILRIGRYTCLMQPAYSFTDLFAPAQCYEIRKVGRGKYVFEGVRGAPSFPAVYDADSSLHGL